MLPAQVTCRELGVSRMLCRSTTVAANKRTENKNKIKNTTTVTAPFLKRKIKLHLILPSFHVEFAMAADEPCWRM